MAENDAEREVLTEAFRTLEDAADEGEEAAGSRGETDNRGPERRREHRKRWLKEGKGVRIRT